MITDNAGILTGTFPADPVKSGYIFENWTLSDGSIINAFYTFTSSVTVTAKYKELIKVTFDPNNGENTFVMITDDAGKLSALPSDPIKQNYKFRNWTLSDGTVINAEYIFTLPLTVIAQYDPLPKITFDPNGGQLESNFTNPVYTNIDGTLTRLPIATKSDHVFKYWILPDGSTADITQVYTSDTILTAFFEKQKIIFIPYMVDSMSDIDADAEIGSRWHLKKEHKEVVITGLTENHIMDGRTFVGDGKNVSVTKQSNGTAKIEFLPDVFRIATDADIANKANDCIVTEDQIKAYIKKKLSEITGNIKPGDTVFGFSMVQKEIDE